MNNLSIAQAKKLLQERKTSASELVESCLSRIAEVDRKLNAFITVTEDYAKQTAREIDQKLAAGEKLGPLAGIPIALKDIYSTQGIATTAGSNVLQGYIPPYDATAVKKLKEAGAIIVGKTNLDAFAHGGSGENSDFGPTKNPYDLTKVPGGSSSGSAVSVAVGESLVAMGTDTGGSIRLPASFCNVVGLKPTYGRVSRYGVIAMASSLDCIGHFTRTVEDSALVLSVTAGHDPYDATSREEPVPDYVSSARKPPTPIKIGLPKEYFREGLDPAVNDLVLAAVKKMEELGATISEVSLPHTEAALAVYYVICPSEVSANLARFDGIRFGHSRDHFGAEAKRRIMLGTYALSAGYFDAYYLQAQKVRSLIVQDFAKVFKQVDVLVAPVSPTLAFNLGEKVNDPLAMYLSDVLTVPMNLAGVPSLAVPCGFAGDLPVGLQIIGPALAEEKLFRLGNAYEQVTNFWQKVPEV
ncbi:MAG: Asp-tRNA(Asn)/Glu-tRNA(Gln) amidotransferase subunit GatA [bacterium]|nr:Asp-tRNA(Asn)/Glu-tRNA(Gln) amidotransferase subunit GatA [bacterium]